MLDESDKPRRGDASDLDRLMSWCRGDVNSLSLLYAKHQATLTRFFEGKVRPLDVDELLQRTWTAILEARDAFAAGFDERAGAAGRRSITITTSFRAYLLGVARHELYAYYRARRRAPEAFDPERDTLADLEPTLSHKLRVRERLERVQLALQMLSIEQQTLLEFKMFQDLTGREIAAVYDVPVSTAKSRIAKARINFERNLARLERLYSKRPSR